MQTEKISGEIQKYTVYTHILELRDRERQVDKYILRGREREKQIIQKQRAKEKIRNGERKREKKRSTYGSLFTKIPPPRQINIYVSYSIQLAI